MRNGRGSVGKRSRTETDARNKSQEILKKKRSHIAKKAAKLFIKKGYSQTTMREISKATGINLGNLYNFIDSKEGHPLPGFSAPSIRRATEWFGTKRHYGNRRSGRAVEAIDP